MVAVLVGVGAVALYVFARELPSLRRYIRIERM
jgi:hypothetical protein